MKIALFLVAVILALAYTEASVGSQQTLVANTYAASESLADYAHFGSLDDEDIHQQALLGDVDFKLMTVPDGTPSGKCYCSCNFNNQLVFLNFDADKNPGNYIL